MSSDTPKMSSLMKPSRICTECCTVAVSSAAVAQWRHLHLSCCWSLLLMVEVVQKSHYKRNSPTLATMPNSILGVFNPAHLGTAATSSLSQWDIQASSPLSELFPLFVQGAEAAILQSDQFLEAAMIHSNFYNCSCSRSYKIYKCSHIPSPFKEMLDNTNPYIRALRDKCELH